MYWRTIGVIMKVTVFSIFLVAVSTAKECSIDMAGGDFKIEPEYIFFGEVVDLFCTIKGYPQVNASNIFIESWNGTLLETSSLFENSTAKMMHAQDMIEVYMVKPITAYVDYKCIYKDSHCEEKIGDTVYAIIDSKPQKVTNGSCVVYNWESMICTWDLGVIYRNTMDSKVSVAYKNTTNINFRNLDYDTSLKWRVHRDLSPCPNQRITKGKCLTCEFTKNQGRDSYKPMQYVFVIDITNNKRNINVTSNFHFNTLDLVQPAKVYNVTTSTDKTTLNLSWHHSKPFRNIQYHAQYKSEWEDEWKGKTYAVHNTSIQNLIPYTNYDIRISCIPLNLDSKATGFWSEVHETQARTKEDVPSAVPTLLPSFFSCEANCNKVQIYWKPIQKEDRRCKEIQYKILLNETTTRPVLYKPDGSVSAEFEIDPKSTTTIYLTQFNDQTGGNPRIKPSSIMVLPKHFRPVLPSGLTVITDDPTGKSVSVTWTYPPESAVRPFNGEFVVVWCKGNKTKCQEEINWNIVTGRTQYNFTVSSGIVDDYVFGVSAEGTLAGIRISSGIKWADCVLTTNQIMGKKYEDSIKIKWRPYSCDEFRGHITMYTIVYCKTDRCNETMVTVTITGNLTSYDLKDLTPGKYNVWLIPESDRGKGPRSEIVNFNIFSKDFTTDESGTVLTTIVIIIIIIVSVMLTGLITLWRRCKNILSHETKIEMPLIILTHGNESESPSDTSESRNTTYSNDGKHRKDATESTSNNRMFSNSNNVEEIGFGFDTSNMSFMSEISRDDESSTQKKEITNNLSESATQDKRSPYELSESETKDKEAAGTSVEEKSPLLKEHTDCEKIDIERTNLKSSVYSSVSTTPEYVPSSSIKCQSEQMRECPISCSLPNDNVNCIQHETNGLLDYVAAGTIECKRKQMKKCPISNSLPNGNVNNVQNETNGLLDYVAATSIECKSEQMKKCPINSSVSNGSVNNVKNETNGLFGYVVGNIECKSEQQTECHTSSNVPNGNVNYVQNETNRLLDYVAAGTIECKSEQMKKCPISSSVPNGSVNNVKNETNGLFGYVVGNIECESEQLTECHASRNVPNDSVNNVRNETNGLLDYVAADNIECKSEQMKKYPISKSVPNGSVNNVTNETNGLFGYVAGNIECKSEQLKECHTGRHVPYGSINNVRNETNGLLGYVDKECNPFTHN